MCQENNQSLSWWKYYTRLHTSKKINIFQQEKFCSLCEYSDFKMWRQKRKKTERKKTKHIHSSALCRSFLYISNFHRELLIHPEVGTFKHPCVLSSPFKNWIPWIHYHRGLLSSCHDKKFLFPGIKLNYCSKR